jgi:ornithine decarboxylase
LNYQKGIVLQQYKKAKELADIVSYSSKTNPDVTPILEEETDASFNIHTVEELKRVQDKTRVYFFSARS